MGKVIPLGNVTYLDIDPDLILENNKGKLASVLIMGWTKDDEFFTASSQADGGEVLWFMELCKQRLMQGVLVDEDEG